MLKIRKLTSNKKSIVQLIIMIFLTILTQIFTLLKTSIAAQNFGTSIEMDAFNFTNSIGAFLFSFIGAGVTTLLIPSLMNKKNKKEINIFISFLYLLSILILVFVFIFRNEVLRFLSHGSESFILISSKLMFAVLLTQLILSISGVTNAVFQCEEKFNIPKVINLITTIILVILLFITKNMKIEYYTYTILITTIINIVIQIYVVYKLKFNFKLDLSIKNKGFIDMIRSFIPIMLSTGLYQISLMTDTVISSRLGEGQVSILTYSNTIMSMINTLLLANIIMYIYPKIVKKIDSIDSQKRLFELITFVNSIIILLVLGFFVVGRDGIEILYQRGEFTSQTTSIVYGCSLIYVIGLPVNAIRDLIYRYFYAKLDTKTPFKNSVIASILNVIISVILARYIGIYGIIIGTSITSYISFVMILVRFYKKFKFNFNIYIIIKENVKIILSMIVTLLIYYLINNFINIRNIYIDLIINSIIIIFIYGITLYLLNSKIYTIEI